MFMPRWSRYEKMKRQSACFWCTNLTHQQRFRENSDQFTTPKKHHQDSQLENGIKNSKKSAKWEVRKPVASCYTRAHCAECQDPLWSISQQFNSSRGTWVEHAIFIGAKKLYEELWSSTHIKSSLFMQWSQKKDHKGTEMCQTKCAFKRTIWRYPLQWPLVEIRLLCDDQMLHIKK